MTCFCIADNFSSELRKDEVCGGRQREPGEGRLGRRRLREEADQVRLPVQRALRSTEKCLNNIPSRGIKHRYIRSIRYLSLLQKYYLNRQCLT